MIIDEDFTGYLSTLTLAKQGDVISHNQIDILPKDKSIDLNKAITATDNLVAVITYTAIN